MARTVGISFFYLNFVGEQLELELFPLILMENFWIRIWIRMKNFRIQDPDPYNNSYGSASMHRTWPDLAPECPHKRRSLPPPSSQGCTCLHLHKQVQ